MPFPALLLLAESSAWSIAAWAGVVAAAVSLVDYFTTNPHEGRLEKGLDNISKLLADLVSAVSVGLHDRVKNKTVNFVNASNTVPLEYSSVFDTNGSTLLFMLQTFSKSLGLSLTGAWTEEHGMPEGGDNNALITDFIYNSPISVLGQNFSISGPDNTKISISALMNTLLTGIDAKLKISEIVDALNYTDGEGVKRSISWLLNDVSSNFYFLDNQGVRWTLAKLLNFHGIGLSDKLSELILKLDSVFYWTDLNGLKHSISEIFKDKEISLSLSDLINQLKLTIGETEYTFVQVLYNLLKIQPPDNQNPHFSDNVVEGLIALAQSAISESVSVKSN